MKLFFVIIGAILLVALSGLVIIGARAPETFIYNGKQVPNKYLEIAKELNVLGDDEEVLYFYSDGLLDIKEGFYLVTDKNLIVYCAEWNDEGHVVSLENIINIVPRYDDSFLDDSLIYVETTSGLQLSFPLSSEKGLDRKFVEALSKKLTLEEAESN